MRNAPSTREDRKINGIRHVEVGLIGVRTLHRRLLSVVISQQSFNKQLRPAHTHTRGHAVTSPFPSSTLAEATAASERPDRAVRRHNLGFATGSVG